MIGPGLSFFVLISAIAQTIRRIMLNFYKEAELILFVLRIDRRVFDLYNSIVIEKEIAQIAQRREGGK